MIAAMRERTSSDMAFSSGLRRLPSFRSQRNTKLIELADQLGDAAATGLLPDAAQMRVDGVQAHHLRRAYASGERPDCNASATLASAPANPNNSRSIWSLAPPRMSGSRMKTIARAAVWPSCAMGASGRTE